MDSIKRERRALTDPDGVWTYENLIGAKVHIKSVSGWNNLFGASDEDETLKIVEVKFKINLDGKVETVVELSDKPGKLYHLKDLEIIQVTC